MARLASIHTHTHIYIYIIYIAYTCIATPSERREISYNCAIHGRKRVSPSNRYSSILVDTCSSLVRSIRVSLITRNERIHIGEVRRERVSLICLARPSRRPRFFAICGPAHVTRSSARVHCVGPHTRSGGDIGPRRIADARPRRADVACLNINYVCSYAMYTPTHTHLVCI
jgi:hypothetical protein